MREIVIYYIHVITKQVEECAISCTSEKYYVNLSISISHPINLRYAYMITFESGGMSHSKKNSLFQ
jgi:hypothetical protein